MMPPPSSRPGLKRAFAILIAAGALTGGGIYVVTQQGGGIPEGTAHIWVDTSGGSCQRSSTPVEYPNNGTECGSFDAANDICQNNDTVLIMGGTYGGQTITGGNGRTATCTMEIADGESATLNGTIQFSAAERVSLDGGGSRFGVNARLTTSIGGGSGAPGGAASQNQYGMGIHSGSRHITLQGADFGGWFVIDSQNTVVRFNDIGPCANSDSAGTDAGTSGCDNGSYEYCEVTELGCAGYNQDHLVEGNYIHDFGCDQNFYNGSGSDDCHWECMYVSYPRNLTIRGNIWVNCANGGNIFNTFSNGGGSFTADFGYTNYVVENNVFTQSCTNSSPPCGGRHDVASGVGHCNIYEASQDFDDVVIRFNTFLVSSGFDLECVSAFGLPGGDIPTSSEFRVYGNITKFTSGAVCGNNWAANQGGANPSNDYNIYYTNTFTCGTNGTNVGSTISSIVTVDSNTSPDAHLSGSPGSTTADNYVPVALGCPTTDIDGEARATSGSCDAGADER